MLKLIALTGLLLAVATPELSYANDASCNNQFFVGRGKTEKLSFSLCKAHLATETFRAEFVMDCQRGLVTYRLKQEPDAQYLQLDSEGKPVSCAGT